MAPSAKDIQFRELKDTISQLNTTIRTQTGDYKTTCGFVFCVPENHKGIQKR